MAMACPHGSEQVTQQPQNPNPDYPSSFTTQHISSISVSYSKEGGQIV
jgi:hypothetical protein